MNTNDLSIISIIFFELLIEETTFLFWYSGSNCSNNSIELLKLLLDVNECSVLFGVLSNELSRSGILVNLHGVADMSNYSVV